MLERTQSNYDEIKKAYSKYYHRFLDAEFERRYREIRKMMSAYDLSCILIHGDSIKSNRMQANVRYISNFVDEVMSYVFFPLEGEPTQWIDIRPHLVNARTVSVIKDVRCRRIGWWSRIDMGQALVDRIKETRLNSSKIGIVGVQSSSLVFSRHHGDIEEGAPNWQIFAVIAVIAVIAGYSYTYKRRRTGKPVYVTGILLKG